MLGLLIFLSHGRISRNPLLHNEKLRGNFRAIW